MTTFIESIFYCYRTGSKLGISPLMLAAMNGHTAAVKLLLDMGSDINAQVGILKAAIRNNLNLTTILLSST